MYNFEKPNNKLPLLPPNFEVETKKILKQAIASNKILAELKGRANEIPKLSLLILL